MLESHDQIDDGYSTDFPSSQAQAAHQEEAADGHQESQDDSDHFSNATNDWTLDISSYKSSNSSKDDDENDIGFESFVAAEESLREHLIRQLSLTHVSDRDRKIICLLIESLDDDGYLELSLQEMLDALPYELDLRIEELSTALALLQHFDPAGIAARSPSECLRLQISRDAKDNITCLALTIIDHHLDWLATRDYVRLKKALKCQDSDLKQAIDLILSLNPRPGAQFSAATPRYIIPDTIVKKHKGQWVVTLNEEAIPKLKINRLYASMLQGTHINRKDSETLHGQLQEARWFIKNIQQRFETILRVSTAIVERQADFFDHGEISMRPLVLKEIADILELHESTISRVTTQKYIQTPRGIYELKYFFGSHCGTESGGACSSTAIRALIKQLIDEENTKKPLSDSKIAELLSAQGIVVARRTVAKYRELLQIPPVSKRKTI